MIKIVLIIVLLAAFFWDIVMVNFAFTRKDTRGAAYFSMLSGALLFYTLGYMLEVMSVTPAEVMLALRIENLGIPLIAPCFLLTTMGFFYPKLLRPWVTVASVGYGVMMFLFVFFNEYHHLYYTSVEMVYNGAYYAVKLGKGPLYFVQQGVTFAGMFYAYGLLTMRFVRGSEKLRKQMSLFIMGSIIGFVSNLSYMLGIVPLGIDPTPISLTVGLVFFSVSLAKYNLMDVVPAAFDMVVERMDQSVIVMDTEWSFIYCNKKAKYLFPELGSYSGTEDVCCTKNWPSELCPETPNPINFSMNDPTTKEKILQRADIEAIRNRSGEQIGTALVIRDITEVTNMLNRLESLAITDPLTGAFNRRHFMTLVDRQMGLSQRHNLPLSILMLDIDHFKKVNDTYSHLAGDAVLCRIAHTVGSQMRAHDVLARYGGEEFVILSTEKDERGLLAFAERLRSAVETEVVVFEGQPIHVTASFGAVMILPGQDFNAGMEAVDKALYQAKDSGRNRVALGKIVTK